MEIQNETSGSIPIAKSKGSRPSRFLELPLELRTMVYAYALTSEYVLRMKKKLTRDTAYPDTLSFDGTLLLSTCRQVYHEDLETFYGRNLFHLSVLSFPQPSQLQQVPFQYLQHISIGCICTTGL